MELYHNFYVLLFFLDKVSILTKKKQNNSKREKIRKLKGRQLQQSIPYLSWISKGGNKDPSVSRMRISFMTLFKLGKLSMLGYFFLISATTLVYVLD